MRKASSITVTVARTPAAHPAASAAGSELLRVTEDERGGVTDDEHVRSDIPGA